MKSFVNWNEKKTRKSNAESTHNKDFEMDDFMAQLTEKQNQIFDIMTRQAKVQKMKRPRRWIVSKTKFTIRKNKGLNDYIPETEKTYEWENFTNSIYNKPTNQWQHPKRALQNINKPLNLHKFVEYLWVTAFILILLIIILLIISVFK